MFLKELAIKLLKQLSINKYIINLKISKQLLYKLIYSFKSIKLEILNTYINTNLANIFTYFLS